MEDAYLTIRAESRVEIKIKDSRFIGETFLVGTPEDASARLESVRKREFAATHHCYAWQAGIDKVTQFKYSDDGEPSGTAGRPIYDVLTGAGLTNTLVVVTRYFGGTKLGTGGLTHAYSDAAKAVIHESGSEQHFLTTTLTLRMAFSCYDRWLRLQHKLGATVIDARFGENVVVTLAIRNSLVNVLRNGFVELTAGKGRIDIVEA
jgi:uncharacterized YigZ family protein